MRELSVRTCLMIFLYDAPTSTSCRADEHSQIIDAVSKRDVARAERLMLEHLVHIESSMAAGQRDRGSRPGGDLQGLSRARLRCRDRSQRGRRARVR